MTARKIIDELKRRISHLESHREYLLSETHTREGGPSVQSALRRRLNACDDELACLRAMLSASERSHY